MSKVLFIYERVIPTVAISENTFSEPHYKTRGMDVTFLPAMNVQKNDIEKSDVIVFIRPENYLSYSLLSKAKKSGCFAIVMCDDDLLNKPDSIPDVPWRTKSLEKSIKKCDVFLSSSKYLCEKYVHLVQSGRAAHIDTAVSIDSIHKPKIKNGDEVKLLYAAGANHEALFIENVLPVMPELIQRFGRGISLTFMGVRPDVGQLNDEIKVNYISPMPLIEFRKKMADGGYDIGLAPLNTDSFSKCKYFNKFIEYTQAGIPGIYTNTEPYTFVVKDGVNGFLSDNTKESWLERLTEVISSSDKRKECIFNAQELLVKEFNPDRVAEKLLEDIPEFQTYNSHRSDCKTLFLSKVFYRIIRVLDVIYLSSFTLNHSGLRGLLLKIKDHRAQKTASK